MLWKCYMLCVYYIYTISASIYKYYYTTLLIYPEVNNIFEYIEGELLSGAVTHDFK